MLQKSVRFLFFLGLSSILLCQCTTAFLSTHLLMDIWAASKSGLFFMLRWPLGSPSRYALMAPGTSVRHERFPPNSDTKGLSWKFRETVTKKTSHNPGENYFIRIFHRAWLQTRCGDWIGLVTWPECSQNIGHSGTYDVAEGEKLSWTNWIFFHENMTWEILGVLVG